MIGLPPRTPLENSVTMARQMQQTNTNSTNASAKPGKKKCNPEKLGHFIDELTEAYALCSAHEQIAQDLENMRKLASEKRGLTLPALPQASTKPMGVLQKLLGKTKIKT